MRRLLLIALAAAAAAACSSYDPKLPDHPFLCGSNEPRCPDGYTCVPEGSNRMVCSLDGEPVPDASVAGADESPITRP